MQLFLSENACRSAGRWNYIDKETGNYECGDGGCRHSDGKPVEGIQTLVSSRNICGFLGPNGAGKTTTIKILMDLIKATSGKAYVLGRPSSDVEVKAKIGFLPDSPAFSPQLTAREFLNICAKLLRLPSEGRAERIEEVLETVKMAEHAKEKIGSFSRGMLQRIGVAQAILNKPELLILDEPTSGLDVLSRDELMDILSDYVADGEHSVIFSTHITADLEQIADSIAYLHNGQLLFQENKDDLLQEYGVLHCGESVLPSLPADLVIFTKRGAFGCESLVKNRAAVQELLPDAVCDAARLDDIMRFYSGRDAQ